MFDQIEKMKNETNRDEYEKILIDTWRLIKFHNPVSLLHITADDLKSLSKNLKEQYSTQIVKTAFDEIKNFYANKNLTLGIFLEKCHAIKKSQDEINDTSEQIKTDKNSKYGINKENFTKIKEMLANSKAIKPLPYNKEERLYSHECRKIVKGEPLKAAHEISFDDPIWDQHCYSDGPKLYEKAVAVGAIAPIESIQNPELKALYYKAWTQGLENEEKARFYELSAKVS